MHLNLHLFISCLRVAYIMYQIEMLINNYNPHANNKTNIANNVMPYKPQVQQKQ
jgi:hypothetical protein